MERNNGLRQAFQWRLFSSEARSPVSVNQCAAILVPANESLLPHRHAVFYNTIYLIKHRRRSAALLVQKWTLSTMDSWWQHDYVSIVTASLYINKKPVALPCAFPRVFHLHPASSLENWVLCKYFSHHSFKRAWKSAIRIFVLLFEPSWEIARQRNGKITSEEFARIHFRAFYITGILAGKKTKPQRFVIFLWSLSVVISNMPFGSNYGSGLVQ